MIDPETAARWAREAEALEEGLEFSPMASRPRGDWMKTVREKWIDAAKVLADDKKASVTCPVCSKAELVVTDTASPDGTKTSRSLWCGACGASNELLLRGP